MGKNKFSRSRSSDSWKIIFLVYFIYFEIFGFPKGFYNGFRVIRKLTSGKTWVDMSAPVHPVATPICISQNCILPLYLSPNAYSSLTSFDILNLLACVNVGEYSHSKRCIVALRKMFKRSLSATFTLTCRSLFIMRFE